MNAIDEGLAARSYVRRKLGFYPCDTYTEIAEDCGCSPQRIRMICEGALAKVRVRLAERGVSRIEALMLLEVLGKGDSYHAQAAEPDEPEETF